MLNHFRHHNWKLTFCILALCAAGLVNVFATTYLPAREVSADFYQQAAFIAIGLIAYFIISFGRLARLLQNPWILGLIWTFALVALVLTKFVGGGDGPKRWFNISGFTLQPAEFSKITLLLIIPTVWYAIDQRWRYFGHDRKLMLKLAVSIVLIALPALAVLYQPSLGAAAIHVFLGIGLLITLWNQPKAWMVLGASAFAGVSIATAIPDKPIAIAAAVLCTLLIAVFAQKVLHVSAFVAVVVIIAFVTVVSAEWLWQTQLTQYQRDRVIAFFDPSADVLGSGWQRDQAQKAIAAGGLTGTGFLTANRVNSGLVPYAYTDFAYTAFSEQFGMLGISLLMLVYLYLIYTLAQINGVAITPAMRASCIGMGTLIGIHVCLHIAMNLGLLPISGTPLSLISYGGSHTIAILIGLGICQSFYAHAQQERFLPTIDDFAL